MSSNPRVEEVDGGVELQQTFTELFRRVARTTADISGSGPVFLIMLTIVIVWAVSGPYFRFSDTWQLAINTGT
jgi:low affinity Fe/Cu permease